MRPVPEPWSSAELYLNTHGARAEAEVERLAQRLGAGRETEIARLYEVYRAIRTLRRSAAVIH
jgi:hypothetical protein